MKNTALNSLIFLIAAVIFATGCSKENTKNNTPSQSPKPTIHYNIIITADLSNRLTTPKPVSDQEVVERIIKSIPNIIKHGGRKTNQDDIFSVSILNKKHINQYNIDLNLLKIDFSKFEKQIDRIQYITGVSKTKTLEEDRDKFVKEFNRVLTLASTSTSGADVWSYFDKDIDQTMVLTQVRTENFDGKTYTNQYRNILILLTDGYIEASMYGQNACPVLNQCYYLSGTRVKEFRNTYLKDKSKKLKEFFDANNYGIIPVKNPYLKDLDILVLQIEDRSLNKNGNATIYPTDWEIMQIFWSDWLSKSGVKHFDIKPVLSSAEDTEKVIMNFLEGK